MKRKSFKKVLFWFLLMGGVIIGFIFWPEYSMAQVGPPGLLDDPEQTPIDGGLGILAALGGAYAIKKLRDKNKV